MVALTPRFTILSAFVFLAAFSSSPIYVGAAAVYKPGVENRATRIPVSFGGGWKPSTGAADANQENLNKRSTPWQAFRTALDIARLKAKKRHPRTLVGLDLTSLLGGGGVAYEEEEYDFDRKRDQHPFHARQTRNADLKSHVLRDEGPIKGTVEVMSPDERHGGVRLGSFVVKDMANGSRSVEVAQDNASEWNMVKMTSTSRAPLDASDAGSLVALQYTKTPDGCVTWHQESPEPLTLDKCSPPNGNKRAESTKNQLFTYNSTSGVLRPYAPPASHDDVAGSSAQGVLTRDNIPTARNVTLVFRPSPNAQAADVEASTAPSNATAVTSTSTITTTMFVTGTPAAAMDVTSTVPTSNAEASPISSGAIYLTSSTAAPAPTAGAAGAFDVEVVTPSSSSTSMLAPTSLLATSTTSMKAQDVTTSITDSSAAPTSSAALATDAPGVTPPAPSTTADNSAVPSSSTEASAMPTMTPLSTDPYHWVFRRE